MTEIGALSDTKEVDTASYSQNRRQNTGFSIFMEFRPMDFFFCQDVRTFVWTRRSVTLHEQIKAELIYTM